MPLVGVRGRRVAVSAFLLAGMLASTIFAPKHAMAATNGTWTDLINMPGTLALAPIAYDPVTKQTILFGGFGPPSGFFGSTWDWNGSEWSQLNPVDSPPASSDGSMAFDPAIGDLVLFGGASSTSALNQTWLWNGSDWKQVATPPNGTPPARWDAMMAFDAQSQQLVLFGGYNPSGYLNDTWVFTGTRWQQLNPRSSPQPRSGGAMAYDPAMGKIVLFSGYSGSSEYFYDDTWTWDGSNWQQMNPPTSPPPRALAAIAYDGSLNELMLFGGHQGNNFTSQSSGNVYYGDTWAFNGRTWTDLSENYPPSARLGAYMTFTPGSGLVSYGGYDYYAFFNSTYLLPNGQWTAAYPPGRYAAANAFDGSTGDLIVFGGIGDNFEGCLGDTWLWNGTQWLEQSPSTVPPPTCSASMAYDEQTSQVILFGGYTPNGYLNTTWLWDGSNWQQLSPATSPPARADAMMAYDAQAGQIILFGGFDGSQYMDDTWAWNGSNWQQLNPATIPPARADAMMAYDYATQKIVLFGGTNGSSYFDDTWLWDGSNWSQVNTLTSPPEMLAGGMTYDKILGQIVLFGGDAYSPSNGWAAVNIIWLWNGTTWSQASVSGQAPSPRFYPVMDYDDSMGSILMADGLSPYGWPLADTWAFSANGNGDWAPT